ncbi:hypothetical protein FS749_006950 [Ceratobasidium sp. UAMH 11750]|nr:hypothetical protein FS749_006950 [Ceratobasidium sp. UAMH 11750]
MTLRGILKSPTAFPLEHEFRSREVEPRTRSRSRDRHADEALHLVGSALHREKSTTSSHSSRRTTRSRRRSQSRPRRHVRWSDPIEFVVSDGKDMLLRHRRSSLPGILEDTRTIFRESLHEQDKKPDGTSAPLSSGQISSSSSSRRRPALKAALSSPSVGRAPQNGHLSKQAQIQVRAPTPISIEHRKRRSSLPDGLEVAVKSSSHALWLPHPGNQQKDRPAQGANSHSPPRSNTAPPLLLPAPHASGHSHHSNGHGHSIPQTPRRHEPSQLPPHLHEQPNLRGRGLAPPPPITFTSQQSSRPVSQLSTSTLRSSKSSPPEKQPPLLLGPPTASPMPPAKPMSEPATPRYVAQ